ncbi:DUF6714 family protein [Blastopirellula marina]|uniref:Uncharacterized protein n=1 Tax=Blastopirellula marina TaxID=124 RepID=A0A2S8GG40_9BACT|nr:DUF6714 family protein [Blastopirellula marina]PQO43436.1 hypothetical protein C5Y98_00560 [Blastopirellula marina]PTL46750.1 hypothetical protein C5Y97_00560 [Blastopirellula marina]
MKDEAAELIDFIRDAFRGVPLGDGIGLRQAEGLDDYASAEQLAQYREQDERLDWSQISPAMLAACESSLRYFDAAGMRFHLPAFVIRQLSGPHQRHLDVPLIYPDPKRHALLTTMQREAVRRYLTFVYKCYEDPEDTDVPAALAGYWNETHDPVD